jgi:hypothetical protein
MKRTIFSTLLSITIIMASFLAGCQPATPAALSNDQVIGVVDNLLTAINQENYPNFSRDFSDEMKKGFTEQMFTNLAALLKNASGNYVSCAGASPELSNNQGYAVYRLVCTFEKESVVATVTFKTDGDKVEGLFFDSTNLRKASQ